MALLEYQMNTRLVIDKAGRVVIPKPLREELHLEPGDALELESGGGEKTPRPGRGNGPPQKEADGWGVFTRQPVTPPPPAAVLPRRPGGADAAEHGHSA